MSHRISFGLHPLQTLMMRNFKASPCIAVYFATRSNCRPKKQNNTAVVTTI
nr:MAG TPA: hypothetical protein [Caudoviricetes sp.]